MLNLCLVFRTKDQQPIPSICLYSVANIAYQISRSISKLDLNIYKGKIAGLALLLMNFDDKKLYAFGVRIIAYIIQD